MSVLKAVNTDTATTKSKDLLARVEQRVGGKSNMMRIMANSPAILGAYLSFNQAFEEVKMTPKLRALITTVVAELNGCDYTLSTAMVLGPRVGASTEELNAAREIRASEPKAAAALQFTAQLIENRGHIPASEVEKLHAAEFSDEEIVEIVALIALNIFRNYLNLVAGTEIDLPAANSKRTQHGQTTAR